MSLSNGIDYPVMWHLIPEVETSMNDHISSRISYRSMILKVQIAQLLMEDLYIVSAESVQWFVGYREKCICELV
jgi:hypothetical protein